MLSVNVNLGQGIGFEPYDLVQEQVNWTDMLGKPLQVKYQYPDGTIQKVSQSVYSWNQFFQLYPRFSSIGSQVIVKHQQILHIVQRSWKWRATTIGLEIVGLGRQSR